MVSESFIVRVGDGSAIVVVVFEEIICEGNMDRANVSVNVPLGTNPPSLTSPDTTVCNELDI